MVLRKGALIGFGQVAEKAHAPAWIKKGNFSIEAIAEPSASRRSLAQRIFPGSHIYKSAQELFRKEKNLDFVDISSPPHLHFPHAVLAFENKTHVLCEKPLGLTPKAVDDLRRCSEKARKVLYCVHNWKYAPLIQKLNELLKDKSIGMIHHIQWHTLRSRPATVSTSKSNNWRTDRTLSGGGILMDHGWHSIYLLRWLLGREPISVLGDLKFSNSGPEYEACCLMNYGSTTAFIYLSWNAAFRNHWGIFYGSSGSLEVRDDCLLIKKGSLPPQVYSFPEGLSKGSAHPEWFYFMLDDFQKALETPASNNETIREAVTCIQTIDLIYKDQANRRSQLNKKIIHPRMYKRRVHALKF